jgi:SAM-dependent methyltransferase
VTSKPADHYSYTFYADPSTAEQFDARRFGGPIGELVAAGQARVLLEMAGDVHGRSVLDVGTGTGRAALLLARAGAAAVTGVDASEQMLAIARQRAAAGRFDVRFDIGDAHRLEFGDRSIDLVVSLRMLMHTPDWRQCVSELCRVARGTSRTVCSPTVPSGRRCAPTDSTSSRSTVSSCCRLRCTRRSVRLVSPKAPKPGWTESGCAVSSGRRLPSSRSGARPSDRRDRFHRRPPGPHACWPRQRGTRARS